MEVWKEIENTNSTYFISNTGFVKSVGLGNNRFTGGFKILKPNPDKYGYFRVSIYIIGDDGKRHLTRQHIHQLVAKYFIPNPDNLSTVDHIDMDKSNNKVENLRWLSVRDNSAHQYRLTNLQLKKIRLARARKKRKDGGYWENLYYCVKVSNSEKGIWGNMRFKTIEQAKEFCEKNGIEYK